MKATEQAFPVVRLMMQSPSKVVLSFEIVDETLK